MQPEAYELLDQRDEDQILAEIKGNIITEMFYSFRVGGKEVTGISWVGTKEVARQYGNIKMDFIDLKDMGESFMAIVRATDTRTDTGLLGSSTQSKQMEIHDFDRDGKWLKDTNGKYVTHLEPDKFASTKAISKAQRNGIRAIIPEKFLIEMYKQFKQGLDKKPEPRKTVDAEVAPTASPQGPIKYEVPDKKPKAVDPEVERVSLTLEANDLNEDVDFRHIGNVIRVLPGSGFPRDSKAAYDHVLVALMGGKWLSEENRWEVPVG